MAINDTIVSAAKKDYKTFEKDIAVEVENKMKTYLSGFNSYLQKNAFKKED